jgi:hypothetical protein
MLQQAIDSTTTDTLTKLVKNDAVGSVVRDLADKFGVAATYLWTVMVRQAYVEAIFDGLWFLGWVALTVWLWRASSAHVIKLIETDDPDLSGSDVFVGIMSIVVRIALVVGLLVNAYDAAHSLAMLANPEFYPIQKVLELVK